MTKDQARVDELLPCPFCGDHGQIISQGKYFLACCTIGGCEQGVLGFTAEEASLKWNTRHTTPMQDALRVARDVINDIQRTEDIEHELMYSLDNEKNVTLIAENNSLYTKRRQAIQQINKIIGE